MVDSECAAMVIKIDGAVAVAVIDVASERPIGRYFRGPEPLPLERPAEVLQLLRAGPIGDDSTIRELHLTTAFEQQFAKLIDGDRALLVLVTKRDINVGLTWAQLRAAAVDIEPAVAGWRNDSATSKAEG